MIPEELRSRIRRLYFAEHWKIGTISAEVGVHHDAVRHAIEAPRFVNLKYRAKASALDPYKGLIELTLKDHPKLLATRLHAMITPRGYTGSLVQLRRYVRAIRPVARHEAFFRLRTLPGEQAQVDWGCFGSLVVGKAKRPLSCFVMVLSWSRAVFACFTLDQTLESFVRWTTAIPGIATPVRTIVVRENATSGKHRWHTLYILHDAVTPVPDLLHEYRTRQHYEQGHRIGVHDLALDTVPSGYPKRGRPDRPGFRHGPIQLGSWIAALAWDALCELSPSLPKRLHLAHPRTLRRWVLDRSAELLLTRSHLLVVLDSTRGLPWLLPLVRKLNDLAPELPGLGARRVAMGFVSPHRPADTRPLISPDRGNGNWFTQKAASRLVLILSLIFVLVPFTPAWYASRAYSVVLSTSEVGGAYSTYRRMSIAFMLAQMRIRGTVKCQ